MIFQLHWIEDEPKTISIERQKVKNLNDIHIETFETIGHWLERDLISGIPDLLILDLELKKSQLKEDDNFLSFELFKKGRINSLKYTWKKCTNETLKIYKNIANI